MARLGIWSALTQWNILRQLQNPETQTRDQLGQSGANTSAISASGRGQKEQRDADAQWFTSFQLRTKGDHSGGLHRPRRTPEHGGKTALLAEIAPLE